MDAQPLRISAIESYSDGQIFLLGALAVWEVVEGRLGNKPNLQTLVRTMLPVSDRVGCVVLELNHADAQTILQVAGHPTSGPPSTE